MKRLCIFLFLCSFFVLSAEEPLEKLLTGYFQNSLSLQELSLKAEKAALSNKATEISNGMNFSLSTGTITFSFNDGGSFSFSPNASFGIPALQNLKFTASSNVSVKDGKSDTKNTSLGVSVDVYSSAREQREIALLKSERSLLEAQRALQNGFVNTETEFYTKLKNLYNIATKVTSAQKSLYEHSLEFDQLRVQGYSSGSSKYRLKQMDVENDKHNVELYRRELEREVRIFARECGVEYDFEDPMDFLPKEIPSVEAIDVLSFNEDDFVEIERAVWNNTINSKSRSADKAVSVSVNAGYTFAGSTSGASAPNAKSGSDTIDLGSSLAWHSSGLQLNGGVSFPVGADNSDPVYKLSLSLAPNQFRLAAVQKKSAEIEQSLEQNAIAAARKNYTTSVISQQSSLEELKWSESTIESSYAMYSQLESDTASWYQRGIISESEYRSASVNKENYRIKKIINALDIIIYNNKTTTLFNRDGELKNEQ